MLGEEQGEVGGRGREKKEKAKEKGKERSLRQRKRLPWLLSPVLQSPTRVLHLIINPAGEEKPFRYHSRFLWLM